MSKGNADGNPPVAQDVDPTTGDAAPDPSTTPSGSADGAPGTPATPPTTGGPLPAVGVGMLPPVDVDRISALLGRIVPSAAPAFPAEAAAVAAATGEGAGGGTSDTGTQGEHGVDGDAPAAADAPADADASAEASAAADASETDAVDAEAPAAADAPETDAEAAADAETPGTDAEAAVDEATPTDAEAAATGDEVVADADDAAPAGVQAQDQTTVAGTTSDEPAAEVAAAEASDDEVDAGSDGEADPGTDAVVAGPPAPVAGAADAAPARPGTGETSDDAAPAATSAAAGAVASDDLVEPVAAPATASDAAPAPDAASVPAAAPVPEPAAGPDVDAVAPAPVEPVRAADASETPAAGIPAPVERVPAAVAGAAAGTAAAAAAPATAETAETTVLPATAHDAPPERTSTRPEATRPEATRPEATRPEATGPAAEQPRTTPAAASPPAATAATPAAADPSPGSEGDDAGSGESWSPLSEFDEDRPKRRWLRATLVVAGIVVVLGGAYVGAAYALADRVPRGTTVAGVEVGGLAAADAEEALTSGLGDLPTEPVPVTAEDITGSVDPAVAGLSLDVDATIQRLTGVDLRPQRLWEHIVGAGAAEPVTVVDEAALDDAMAGLAETLSLAPVDGSIVFADGAPHAVDAVDGWSLDTDAARDTLTRTWLTAARPIALTTEVVVPDITQEETDRVLQDVASKVGVGPVVVQVAGQNVELPGDVLVSAASFVPADSDLVLQMDGPVLVEAVIARTTDLLTTASDARFEFQGGAPVIVPGTPGTTLDPAALSAAVAGAVTAEARTAAVELVESDPSQTTAALEALGITSVVAEFSTPLTSEPRRTQNIAAGAAAINGTLVRPGETFSLTDALGPIDAAHGFTTAGAIVNGQHTDAWGGGLSQLSTTTFNAAYLAGMEDIEHKPHSEWFSRYPAGREATLYTGTLDMQWKNNTPYGALVQAYVEGGQTVVKLWGTPYWEVIAESGPKTNVVQPTTVYSQSPTCEAQSPGNPGFRITVTRTVKLNGEVVATEPFSWTYRPQNRVVCGPDPAAAPPAG
jgi:vancomycin resistance protein YoaR